MNEETIIARVKPSLSERRMQHTRGVVETAAQLARRFGADEQKARLAAWIHDMAREWPTEALQQFAEKVEIPSGFALIPEIMHGPIAAALAEEWCADCDEEVLNAVRYHTTGRLNMTLLDMILCLADAIEPSRNYPDVERIRDLAERDLEEALAASFDSTITYLIATHQPIFPLTVMVRNELWDRVRMR